MKPVLNRLFIGLVCLASIACIPVAFGIWGDFTVDYGHSTLAIIARNTQWESIAAGLLGLCGGFAVIYSTQQQIAAMRETTRQQIEAMRETTDRTIRQANSHRVDEKCWPLENTQYVIEETRKKFASAWRQLKVGNEGHVQYELIERIDIFATIWDEARALLHDHCEHLRRILDTHGTTHFGFATYKSISAIVSYDLPVIDILNFHPTKIARKHALDTANSLLWAEIHCKLALEHIETEITAIKVRHGADE